MIPENRHKYIRQAAMIGSLLAGVQMAIVVILSHTRPDLLSSQDMTSFFPIVSILLSVSGGYFAVKITKDATWIHQGFNAPMQGLYAGLSAMLLAITVNGFLTGQWVIAGGVIPPFAAIGGFIAKVNTRN